MMNNKQRYPPPPQMQSYPRPYNPVQGVPPQGAAGSALRNPNAPQNMRVQNGPRQSQPPQQQVHGQGHGGMTGVQVSQHPHSHGGPQPQGQAQHHPQMQFAQFQTAAIPNQQHQQQFYFQTAPVQYHQMHPQAGHFVQFNQRFVNPQAPHQGAYLIYPSQPTQMFHASGHPQTQQTMAPQQQHPPSAQQHNNVLYAQNYMNTTRLPIHSAAGHTAGGQVQVPQAHQPGPGQQVQQTAQHNHQHQQHVNQPPTNSAPIVSRNEGTQQNTTERKRERKILKIVDPTTGAVVIGDANANSSTTPEATPASGGSSGEGNGETSTATTPQDPQTPEISVSAAVASHVPMNEEVEESDTKIPVAAGETDQSPDETKSKARAEFYQKITQASDDKGKGRATGNSQNPVVNPPSPIPASQAPDQPQSPPIDSSKSQQAVTTPAVNTSSDDSKDTSLVSVSPIPLECYLTPRKTSSPGKQVEESSFEEERPDSSLQQEVEEESLSATTKDEPVPVINQSPLESPLEEDAQPQIESEPSSTVEVDNNNTGTDNTEKDEADDEVLSVNDKSESISNEGPGEEQVSVAHQNGSLEDFEEGEIAPDDEEEIEETESGGAEEESGADDGEISEPSDKNKQTQKKKYDREFLLNIGSQMKGTTNKSLISGLLLTDVAKDANSARSHHMAKSPGGPRNDQFNRMHRGGPGQGPRPGLGGMMMNSYGGRGGNQHGGGMMGWPPMVVPPRPPPPKVIELTREEVKLHKAENAWKPALIKHRTGGNDQPKDQEESLIDDIVKKTRGILNKLTPENSEKLTTKFMNLPLEDKEERISRVIKVVFEKAVDEPSFSKQYAKMVHTVCNASQETSRKFRKQILDQCQQEFQTNNSDEDKIKDAEQKLEEADDDKKEQLKAELEDMRFQSRRRSIGNVRFIGELYKLQMLTPKIMVECVLLLLSSSDEESLECLCKLLTTVGQKLEEQLKEIENRVAMVQHSQNQKRGNPEDAPKMPKFIPEEKWMNKTFHTLRNLSESKKLSSRIRFALLDVYELRENCWKPRRDANAPKTIDEVRRDAYRQEMEEKRQISNLPPPSAADQRGSSRAGPPQQKKGDWSTQNSNKSSRFQIKRDTGAAAPLFAPPSQTWGRNNNSGGPNKQQTAIAPRFLNRFHGLSEEKDRLNSNQPPPQPNSRDSIPPAQPPFAPYIPQNRRISPPPSSTSSRENSRPVSPKEPSSENIRDECTADLNETVKNIFDEYCSVGTTSDTLDWIKDRFPGAKVAEFVDELSRQVGEMSKLVQQQKAGTLVRSLIKSNEISLSKETVLSTLSQSVIADLPDIRIDVPMVSNYLAQFLVEIFHDDRNLEWLLSLEEGLQASEEYESSWSEFCYQCLTVLRSKTNEEVVRTMYLSTKGNDRIRSTGLEWLCPDPESLAQEMVPVLQENLVVNSKKEEILQALKEHSWDLREDLISRSLIEAICIITWNTDLHEFDEKQLTQLLPVLPLPNTKIFPILWKQICDFIIRKDIKEDQKEKLWNTLWLLNLTSSKEQPPSD